MTTSILASGAERTPRPFRSHRTFRTRTADGVLSLAATIAGLAAAYGLMRYAWAPCMHVAAMATFGSAAGHALIDRYFGIAYTVAVPVMPAMDAAAALWTAAACALVVFASAVLPGQRNPLRYWINANALVLGGSALYAFFHGTVGYDAAPFMLLIARTGLLTIAVAVPFLSVVSMLLPLSLLERLGMIASALAFEMAISVVRVAAFPLVLQHLGSIPQANLYIFAGPLLDVAYLLAVYSVTLSLAGKRLARREGVWNWL